MYSNSIISRLWREVIGSSRARLNLGQLWENSEPRPPKTTGALMFGWPPKGRSVQVKLASHERAAVVQRLAESEWLPNRSFFYDEFVVKTAVVSRSTSASRVIAASVIAAKHVLSGPAYKSAAVTTRNISEPLKGDGTTQTGSARIATAKRGRK